MAAVAIFTSAVAVDGLAYPEPIEWEFARWINGEREWNGLPPLVMDGPLTDQAQRHSAQMAREHSLYHSSWEERARFLDEGWLAIRENVGMSSDASVLGLFGLHRMGFMRSPGHLANVLAPGKGMGFAIAYSSDGWAWITVLFGDCTC